MTGRCETASTCTGIDPIVRKFLVTSEIWIAVGAPWLKSDRYALVATPLFDLGHMVNQLFSQSIRFEEIEIFYAAMRFFDRAQSSMD